MADLHARARIYAAIRAIPRGQVAGYGHVAARAGLPGRARMVCQALAASGDADLPWHRVVRSDGRIAFPKDSRGFREQCRRLKAEGVAIARGRVRIPPSAPSLDELLWSPP